MSFIGSVLERTAKGTLSLGSAAGSAAWSSFGGRMALGASIGGIAGYASSDQYSFGARLKEGARGAIAGAMIGGAASTAITGLGIRHRMLSGMPLGMAIGGANVRTYKAGVFGASRRVGAGGYSIGEALMGLRSRDPKALALKVGKGTIRAGALAARAGAWAIAHPKTALGITAAGIYGFNATTAGGYGESPTMSGAAVRTDYDKQAIAAESMNIGFSGTSGVTHAGNIGRFERSTDGLVQGLHRGRHG